VYYLSHSVHFTQRCLYILTWTPPQTASLAGALSPPLNLQQLKADLRLWLQMLAQHVPNAKVLLVGTRDDDSAEYQSVQRQVEAAVDAEIEQLNSRVKSECAKLQEMKKACDDVVAAAKSHWTHIRVGRRFDASGGDGSDGDEDEMQWWLKLSEAAAGLEEWQQRIAREVFDGMQRAQMLQQRMSLMKLRDGNYAQLQRVARDRSFTVDCLSGRGVAELQAQLSGVCSCHVPGMGEKLPGWWLSVLHALQEGDARNPMLKTLSMRKADAIRHVRRAVPELSSLHKRQDFASTDGEVSDVNIWSALQFWADLGRIFVYEDFVLPNPLDLLQLIKPLLHHDPPFLLHETCSEDDKKLLLSSCRELSSPSRDACMGYLKRLKNQAVLHRGLLPLLPAWREDPSFHQAMLKFLAECHLMCVTGDASDVSADVLVTARSRDLPAFHSPYPPAAAGLNEDDLCQHEELCGKHDIIRSQFNATLGGSDCCRVLFLVSRYHIGIISRLQALIHTARPSEISLVTEAAKDSLFMCRGDEMLPDMNQPCCAVRVLPSCDDLGDDSVLSAFRKNDGPLSRQSDRRTKCGIVVAASDMALLAFMVRCVEDTLNRWSVCAEFQCWVQKSKAKRHFIQFDCSSFDECALPLSAVLAGNLWSLVVPGVQMRDIFSRQRRCAMFLSYASNDRENTGTRYACETIRNGFQEAALCSVWMDRVDASQSMPGWKLLVREGLQAANVYIVCLTPLYLTRPNCLTELSDILALVTMFPQRKRLIVLPLHPAMTASGRQLILKSGFVLLTDFQDPAVTRKHELSAAALKLLEDLRSHDRGEADSLNDACLNTEPWSSALADRQQNPKWNGVKATLDLCSGIVKLYGLGSLMVCADGSPISDRPFLDESSPCFSIPPSLEPLDPSLAKSSVVDAVDDFDPIFHMFSKDEAIRLAERGVAPQQLHVLVQNSTQALQTFPPYLQRLLKDVDFKPAEIEFGSSEDLAAFLEWSTTAPQLPATRKVICRVEGHDDKLLLHALIALKFPMLQRPSQQSWNDFTYSCSSCVLQIRDCKVVTDKVHDVGLLILVRSFQATAKVRSFVLGCLDLDDQDLKAFETYPKKEPKQDLSLITWRWGRAIENYLLPVSAPAALYLKGHATVSKLTSEVFFTIARHFFPAISEAESKKGKLCGHDALKWNDLIGAGWKAWSDLLKSPDVNVHPKHSDALAAAESLKKFSISVLGVAALLVERHVSLYGSSGSRADEWLLHLAGVRRRVRQGDFDEKSTKGKAENVDWKGACSFILDLPAVKPTSSLNRGDADDAALWFNLPAVCSFLSNLCSCPGIVSDDAAIAGRVKDAAASALRLVQHALCVLLLGCDPASLASQITLFRSSTCGCFLPLVREQAASSSCLTCSRDVSEHALPQLNPSGAADHDFLVELCRVGSVGWQSHAYMKAVYDRTHLGEQFAAEHIDESHRLYEQHVRPLLFGGTVDNERCRDLTVSALPDITVFAITDGKVKEGRMEALMEQRRAEFDRLCGHISMLIDTTKSTASPRTPDAVASKAGTSAVSPKAGGGAAAAGDLQRGRKPNIAWGAVSMDELRVHPSFVALPSASSVAPSVPAEWRLFRQDSPQWWALHVGRITTSTFAACLGVYEENAAEVIGVPPSLRGHDKALNARARLASTLLSDLSLPNPQQSGEDRARLPASASSAIWPSHTDGAARDSSPFLHAFCPLPRTADSSISCAGQSISDIRKDWGRAQEATAILSAVNYFGRRSADVEEAGLQPFEALPDSQRVRLPSGLPPMGASPDAIVRWHNGTVEPLEVKCRAPFADFSTRAMETGAMPLELRDPGPHDDIAVWHIPQMYMHMLCLGEACSSAIFMSASATRGVNIFRVRRDEALLQDMLRFVAIFHADYCSGCPPPPPNFFWDLPEYALLLENLKHAGRNHVEFVAHIPDDEVQRAGKNQRFFLD